MQTRNQPLTSSQMYEIARCLLSHRDFGLRQSAHSPEDVALVDKAIELIVKGTVSEIERDDWTDLKRESLKYVGSDIADAVSRIASAMRTPDIALSGLRDAAEKTIEIASATSARRITTSVQAEVQSILN
jgi:hypothetical protein